MTYLSHTPVFIPFSPNDYRLEVHCVDIWQFSLLNIPKNYKDILNETEIERAKRFHFDIHRHRNIATHSTLKLILSRYLKISAQEIEFDYNAHGKPALKSNPALQFNLSHSQDLALLAIGKNEPLGIDLEYFSARPYEGIGSHIFSEEENRRLQAVSSPYKPLGFFHLWAQKEALIKACGLGLSYPTKQLTLPLLPPVNQIVFDTLHRTYWHLISFMPEVACCAALCCHPSVTTFRFHRLQDLGCFDL